jgi:hypothetical protein
MPQQRKADKMRTTKGAALPVKMALHGEHIFRSARPVVNEHDREQNEARSASIEMSGATGGERSSGVGSERLGSYGPGAKKLESAVS